MLRKNESKNKRLNRKKRVRKKIKGTDERPRLCVNKTLKHTSVQLISDTSSKTLLFLSTKNLTADGKSAKSAESAKLLGQKAGEMVKEKQIENIVFDRNGYLYHGRIKAVADGVRESGLKI